MDRVSIRGVGARSKRPKHRKARPLDRVPVRGVGVAAALVAAAGMAVSANTAVADAPVHPAVAAGATLVVDRAELGQVRGQAASVLAAQDAAARLVAAKAAAVKASAAKAAADSAAAKAAAARAAAAAAASRALVRTSYGGSARALGQQMAAARGWTGNQWVCLDNLWTRESNWRVTASNGRTGAYGIPQALPGSKMGPGWQTSAVTQISWGLGYIGSRYGNPCNAWSFFTSHNWY
jgi:hypothetical protein